MIRQTRRLMLVAAFVCAMAGPTVGQQPTVATDEEHRTVIQRDLTRVPDGTRFFFIKQEVARTCETYSSDFKTPWQCNVLASEVVELLPKETIYSIATLTGRFDDWEQVIAKTDIPPLPFKLRNTQKVTVWVSKSPKEDTGEHDYRLVFLLKQQTSFAKFEEIWTLDGDSWILRSSKFVMAHY